MVRAYRFDRCLCRVPGAGVVRGLRGGDGDDPDPERFTVQHNAYRAVLRTAGAAVTLLPPLEAYPDSVFVEDTALCLGGTAIALRPGALSRRGEATAMVPHLKRLFERVIHLPGPGIVDGGDILVTGREAVVGLSSRTDRTGADALETILAGLELAVRTVPLPPSVLHLKSDCGLLDDETIFATPRLAATGCFAGYTVIEVPEDEAAAANLVRINDTVLVAGGYPKTRDLLAARGYGVLSIDVSEAARLDGGLSCLSLRWSAASVP